MLIYFFLPKSLVKFGPLFHAFEVMLFLFHEKDGKMLLKEKESEGNVSSKLTHL